MCGWGGSAGGVWLCKIGNTWPFCYDDVDTIDVDSIGVVLLVVCFVFRV